MHEHLELMGVNPRAMMMERESRNTHDNAVYSSVVLQGKGVRRILLVTSAYHMRRAVPLFEDMLQHRIAPIAGEVAQ